MQSISAVRCGNMTIADTRYREYKTSMIGSRRYLGNKYKLIPFIRRVVEEAGSDISSIADIFAGTGAVASAFADKIVITNDLLYCNYICNFAWFGPQPYSPETVADIVMRYNALGDLGDNYMTENFADTYFSRDDCAKIGYIREDIEAIYHDGEINERERALLITSLLYAMDKIANTCGHYDAFRRNASFDTSLELHVPLAKISNDPSNMCYNTDANELVREIAPDLIYIDPPYNSRQYCDAYHLLENVARWEKPPVFGAARKMDRKGLKSRYCTRSAVSAFEELVRDIRSRSILLSYNNMAAKGNDRSNAKLPDEDILRILKAKGRVEVFAENHRAFTAGKSDISGHEERLFLCECYESLRNNGNGSNDILKITR